MRIPFTDWTISRNGHAPVEVVEAANLGPFIDPAERFRDDGQDWIPLGGFGGGSQNDRSNFRTEAELTQARDLARYLARFNPFAIGAHENRISYLVGNGHTYRPVAKDGEEVPDDWLKQAKAELDAFYEESNWCGRQRETIKRFDRDGEVFRRIFDDGEIIKVRFVEPWQVASPERVAGAPEHAMGIHTEPDDVESVIGYWVDGEEIPGDEIQHIKANVDCNVRRGCPTFWPVRELLWSAVDTLLNIGKTCKIQTSIGAIRYHEGGTKSALETLRGTAADVIRTNPVTGKTDYAKVNQGGRVLDVSANTKYEFPNSGIDVNRYGLGVQAILRSAASMCVMPEFMFTADASNANYASTMVAEGPAVKNFERLQNEFAAYDLKIMWLVLNKAVDAGRLSEEQLDKVAIEVGYPKLITRDKLAEAQVDEILAKDGILSPQTRSARADLEYEQEQENIGNAPEVAEKARDIPPPKIGPDGKPMPDQKPKPASYESMDAASVAARAAAWRGYVGAEVFEHCGTGAGGFQPGNTCAKGGTGASSVKRAIPTNTLSAGARAEGKMFMNATGKYPFEATISEYEAVVDPDHAKWQNRQSHTHLEWVKHGVIYAPDSIPDSVLFQYAEDDASIMNELRDRNSRKK